MSYDTTLNEDMDADERDMDRACRLAGVRSPASYTPRPVAPVAPKTEPSEAAS